MKNIIIVIFPIAMLFFYCPSTMAQEEKKNNLEIIPIGRFYYDGAVYFEDKTSLSNGATMSDVRLGLKAKYGKWNIKVDMGFSEKKVSPKDIDIVYVPNDRSYLKIGYYGPSFGIEGFESSTTWKFLTNTPITQLSGIGGRVMNASYSHYGKKYMIIANILGDANAFSNDTYGDDGYGFLLGLAYVPIQNKVNLLQFGASSFIRKGDANGYDENDKENPRVFNIGTNMNTRVEKRKPINFTIENVDFQNNTVVYAQFAHKSFYFLTEGYMMNIKRKGGLKTYKADGFYIQASNIFFGDESYSYNFAEKKVGRPSKGLEFALRYSYANMDDKSAGLLNGHMSDISIATNYYFSKYISLRLNYVYQMMGNNCAFLPGENISILQSRLQVVF